MDREERLRRLMEKASSAKSELAKLSRRRSGPVPANLEAGNNAESRSELSQKDVDLVDAGGQEVIRVETADAGHAHREKAQRETQESAMREQQRLAVEAEHALISQREQEQREAQEALDRERERAALEAEEASRVLREREEREAQEALALAREQERAALEAEEASRVLREREERETQEALARERGRAALEAEEASRGLLEKDRQDAARALAERASFQEIVVADPKPALPGVINESRQAEEVASDGPVDNIQEDVLPIVLEEAQEELVPDIQSMLGRLFEGDHSVLAELHRKVHTLKGSLAMVGAMRARALMHSMETWMERAEAGEIDVSAGHERLADLFENVKERIAALARGDHLLAKKPAAPGEVAANKQAAIQAPRRVHLRSDDVDRYITEINEARLANASLSGAGARSRQTLVEIEEKGVRLSRILRELEIHAETQIQSRKSQVEEAGEDFDPLEFDRYTHLQEIVRFLSEGVNDVMDLQREMVRQAAEQETITAYQGRSIESVQEGLQRTRLIQADALADRLHKVVWATSRELGKPAEFYMEGGRQTLDRLLLEKTVGPLEHILRNSIAHGVENAEERQKAGKPAVGSIVMQIRQEAGRVHMIVSDDGRGLDPERIREKAISKGMWPSSRPMSMAEAADMICSAGFSTAETVSEVAGRGVGMDVVRSEVMAMGGRFDIQSITGRGMTISIVLPTAIASMSVVLAEAAGETWAIPVEMVEHMDRITPEKATQAIGEDGLLQWAIGQDVATMRHRKLADLMGLAPLEGASEAGALLILRSGDHRAAVLVDALSGVAELPMRSLGRQWSAVPGVMGATILPDGRAGFLVDPLRADWSLRLNEQQEPRRREKPLIMVVDDSITVRKVTARFLERHGYDHILAKDGQEAVEMLVEVTPDAVLLDVEMPRMDGFDCARHIRENPKLAHLPIIMITSRTADKHRQRALSMGVNAYLGKPFKEEELLPLLENYSNTPIEKA